MSVSRACAGASRDDTSPSMTEMSASRVGAHVMGWAAPTLAATLAVTLAATLAATLAVTRARTRVPGRPDGRRPRVRAHASGVRRRFQPSPVSCPPPAAVPKEESN